MLITVTALAAAKGWNVLQFLFGWQSRKNPEILVTPVQQEAFSERAFLRVDSAVYDGRALAFDWFIENREPGVPMYCKLMLSRQMGYGFGRTEQTTLTGNGYRDCFLTALCRTANMFCCQRKGKARISFISICGSRSIGPSVQYGI